MNDIDLAAIGNALVEEPTFAQAVSLIYDAARVNPGQLVRVAEAKTIKDKITMGFIAGYIQAKYPEITFSRSRSGATCVRCATEEWK